VGAAGQAEVVEEALLRGRADVVLRAREELDDGGGQQVRGAVSEDVERQLGRCIERQAGLSRIVDDVLGHGGKL